MRRCVGLFAAAGAAILALAMGAAAAFQTLALNGTQANHDPANGIDPS
jgi:hypothetical protein